MQSLTDCTVRSSAVMCNLVKEESQRDCEENKVKRNKDRRLFQTVGFLKIPLCSCCVSKKQSIASKHLLYVVLTCNMLKERLPVH